MNDKRTYLAAAAIILAAIAMYPLLVGGKTGVSDAQLQQMVYVDEKTEQPFLLRARSSREKHPKTGELTLVPSLYCEKCKAWKPIGSIESLQNGRSTRKCPIHKVDLVREGPLPESPEK